MSSRETKIGLACLMTITVATMLACSSDGDDGGGTTASTGDIDITTEGTSASGGNSSVPDLNEAKDGGGLVELTSEQVDTITGEECSGVSVEVENVPAVLQLVVDISASMNDPAPGGGGTKWDVTRLALLDALDLVPGGVAVGLQTYPNLDAPISREGDPQTNPGCVSETGRVAIAPLGGPQSEQRAALAAKISDVQLLMGTPTHDAYTFARQSLDAYQGPGNRFMLLITDGAPTQTLGCGPLYGDQAVDTNPIIATITEAASQGVRTFAIGSPGSEGGRAGDMREWLSHAALIGGTALAGCSLRGPDFCHFDMSEAENFSVALAEGLGAITKQVANSCTFEIPDTSADGETIAKDATSVLVEWGDGTSSLALRDSSGSCTEGWVWEEDSIVLCDQTCIAVQADPLARVSVSLECNNAAIDDIVR